MSLAGRRAELARRAIRVVKSVVASLPDDLRDLAEGLPVVCEHEVARHWIEDGVEGDSLGLFSGPARDEPLDPECLESPLVTLFVDNIWDYAEGDPDAFDDEVRTTYLHEFGHYLGLEEDDLEERGLL